VRKFHGDHLLAGRLKHDSNNWGKYTSDREILETASGMKIKFFDNKPFQMYTPHELSLTSTKCKAICIEIDRLLTAGVIIPSQFETGQFISTIFARPKKDGKYRMILNLSNLTEYLEYHHFKMDTLETAIKLMTQNCYMASIDLKDAYYCVPVHKNDQKYLKFTWLGQLYQFTALPNGLSSGPRVFTKLLKPPFAHLRNLGHTIVGYIDDTILLAQNEGDCKKAVEDTKHTLEELGFIIHPDKSVLHGTHELIFLGFVLDSCSMTVRPTEEKCASLVELCKWALTKAEITIQDVASITGKIVSMFPGAQFGPLHYRELEKEKTTALKLCKGNWKAKMTLSTGAKADIEWCLLHAHQVYRLINKGSYDMTLSSDASGLGWGISDGVTEGEGGGDGTA
jgi:hypothetical protein